MARRTHIASVLLTAAAALPLLPPAIRPVAGQVPEGYELLQLTNDPWFALSPRLNARGQVVWSQRLGPSADTTEIFFWDRGRLHRLTNDDDNDVIADINDHGVIVWAEQLVRGDPNAVQIMRLENGIRSFVAEDDTAQLSPAIDNAGRVVWAFQEVDSCSVSQVVLFDGASTTQITSGRYWRSSARMAKGGDMVWDDINSCVNPWVGQTAYYTGGEWSYINTPVQNQASRLNDRGLITWLGPGSTAMMYHDGTTSQLAYYGRATPNNRGQILLVGEPHAGAQRATWLHEDGAFRQVGPGFDYPAINDAGEAVWTIGAFPNTEVMMMRRMTIPGDINADGDCDLDDFALLQLCIPAGGSQGMAACAAADLNRDGAMDADDVAMLMAYVRGPRHPADANYDGRVDLRDYVRLQQCVSDPERVIPPGCWSCDANEDNHVNGEDARIFAGRMSGPAAAGQ